MSTTNHLSGLKAAIAAKQPSWSRKSTGYVIHVVGLSHHIYRPGQWIPFYGKRGSGSAHLCQSMEAAKRWIQRSDCTELIQEEINHVC